MLHFFYLAILAIAVVYCGNKGFQPRLVPIGWVLGAAVGINMLYRAPRYKPP